MSSIDFSEFVERILKYVYDRLETYKGEHPPAIKTYWGWFGRAKFGRIWTSEGYFLDFVFILAKTTKPIKDHKVYVFYKKGGETGDDYEFIGDFGIFSIEKGKEGRSMVIIFKNKKARDFLLRKGFVYTLRPKRKRVGRDWLTDKRGGKKIAEVKIEFIKMITKDNIEDLKEYAPYSGFESLDEWLKEAYKLNGSLPLALYRVILTRS